MYKNGIVTFHESRARRLKKPELIEYVVKIAIEYEEKLAKMQASLDEALESVPDVLTEIRSVLDIDEDASIVEAVKKCVKERDGIYGAIEDAAGEYPDDRERATTILQNQADYANDVKTALDKCVADREALLKRLGLTDRQWSAQGGSCEADFDVYNENSL